MQFSRLKIENWKNFQHGDLKLGNRLFIIGPNASGKSNLLDVFRFLRDIAASGGGLQQAVDVIRGGVSSIRCLAARRYTDIDLDAYLVDDQVSWRYNIVFSQDNNRKPIIKKELVEKDGVVVLSRPNDADKADPLRLTETALEQTSANQEFREVAIFFQTISYQHLLPQVIRDPQGFSPHRVENDPFGRDFLQRVENTAKKTRDSRLRRIHGALQVAAPQLQDLKVERDKFGVPHLVGNFEHWRPNGANQNEQSFSDGTLRMFGLLWILFEGSGPLLLEEPELSLHTEVVRMLPQMIERIHRSRKVKRQVIISSHSEEMLTDPGIDAHEVLRLQPSPEGTLMISPADNPEEVELLRTGLSIADVVFPKSAPAQVGQMLLAFEK